MADFLLEVVLPVIAEVIRWIYYRLRYPNRDVRLRKMAEYDDRMPAIFIILGWVFICSIFLILIFLVLKLTGLFD